MNMLLLYDRISPVMAACKHLLVCTRSAVVSSWGFGLMKKPTNTFMMESLDITQLALSSVYGIYTCVGVLNVSDTYSSIYKTLNSGRVK